MFCVRAREFACVVALHYLIHFLFFRDLESVRLLGLLRVVRIYL
jgi:hypothetical protein